MRTVSSLVCPDAALSCSAFLYSLNARRGFWLTFTYYHRLIYYITRVFCCQADFSCKSPFFHLYPQVLQKVPSVFTIKIYFSTYSTNQHKNDPIPWFIRTPARSSSVHVQEPSVLPHSGHRHLKSSASPVGQTLPLPPLSVFLQ